MFGRNRKDQIPDPATGVITEQRRLPPIERLAQQDQATYDRLALERIRDLEQYSARLRNQARYHDANTAEGNKVSCRKNLKAVQNMARGLSKEAKPRAEKALENIRRQAEELETIQKLRWAAEDWAEIPNRSRNCPEGEDEGDRSDDSAITIAVGATALSM